MKKHAEFPKNDFESDRIIKNKWGWFAVDLKSSHYFPKYFENIILSALDLFYNWIASNSMNKNWE